MNQAENDERRADWLVGKQVKALGRRDYQRFRSYLNREIVDVDANGYIIDGRRSFRRKRA